MRHEKLGTKRLCESCGTKFYDLNKTSITCPKCDAPFYVPEPETKPADGAGASAPPNRTKATDGTDSHDNNDNADNTDGADSADSTTDNYDESDDDISVLDDNDADDDDATI